MKAADKPLKVHRHNTITPSFFFLTRLGFPYGTVHRLLALSPSPATARPPSRKQPPASPSRHLRNSLPPPTVQLDITTYKSSILNPFRIIYGGLLSFTILLGWTIFPVWSRSNCRGMMMLFLLLLLLKCPAAAQTPRNLAPGFSTHPLLSPLPLNHASPPLTRYSFTSV